MARKRKQPGTWVRIENSTRDVARVHCPLDLTSFPVGLSGANQNAAGIMASTLLLQTRKLDIADQIVETACDGDINRTWELIAEYQKMPRV